MNATDTYRIEALLEIAAAYPEPLTAAEVARRRRIPGPFLGRLLAAMARAGTVRTTRGRRGGVRLARPPVAVTLADLEPGSGAPARGRGAAAWLADALADARRAVLERTTLADLVAIERRAANAEDWMI